MNNFFTYRFDIRILSKIFVSSALLVAFFVLLGWQFDINAFKRTFPFWAAMNPLTAFCFLLTSTSFFLKILKDETQFKRYISTLFLCFIVLLCSLRLLDLFYNFNFNIDQILFRDKIEADIRNGLSSNMAGNTAVAFLFSSLALLLINYKTTRLWVPYQILAILVFSFGFVSSLGYLYGAPEFYDLLRYIPMSLHSAFCFMFISFGILLAKPDIGIVKEFTGSLNGSFFGPVMLLSALAIPFFLGLIRVYTHKANMFSTELGIALLVLTIIIVFCCLVLWTVILLNRKDILRIATEDKFKSLVETAPDAIVIIDEKKIIQLVNIQTDKMFGYDRIKIKGQHIDLLIPDLSFDSTYHEDYDFFSTKEYKGIKNDGEIFPVEIRISPLETSESILTSISIRDISVRKLLEEINWNNQEIFRTLVTNVVDYAIFMLDVQGNIVTWNKGAELIKGYKRSEVQGKHISIFYREQEVHIADEMLLEAKEKGKCEREGWRVRKDGSIFWADVILTALHDPNGIITGYAKVTRDFTDKKKMQDTLANFNEVLSIQVNEKTKEIEQTTEQLRQLSAHLQTAREEERKYIAREMHDELGQMITGLRMDMIWLKKKIHTTDEIVLMRFERSLELLNDIKHAMRRIAMDLHPAVLNDLGLITALKVYGKDFESRSGIKTTFDVKLQDIDDLQISSNISIGLYRIFQESLNNVAKHAEANEVNVCLELNEQNLEFRIFDNGQGFNLDEVIQKKSLGLISIRERMLMMDGKYQIQSSPGNGTVISLTVPIKFK